MNNVVTQTEISVQLRGLTRQFPRADRPAVDGIDLDIRSGEFFSLIGPSGCGKTTTLRMLAGLDMPDGGEILLDGEDVAQVPAYRRNVHTVFQNYALFPHLSVSANVAFGLKEKRMSRGEIEERVARMLELVGLGGHGDARPTSLSGGMQQRVALARALVLDPQVLLLDEPLGALDLKLRRQMQGLLKDVQQKVGITFVYVTHDQEEAFSMSDRVGVMNAGTLAQVAAPRECYRHPESEFVATFVGSSNLIPGRVVANSAAGVTVDTSLLGTVTVAGIPSLTAGDDVKVLSRPEMIRLEHGETGDGVRARVTGDTFLGSHARVTVEPEGDHDELLIDVFGSDAAIDLARGDLVRVRMREADLWAMPAADGRQHRRE